MSEVTRILSEIERGDPSAAEQLLPLIYDELRKLAAQKLAQEKPGQTLRPPDLVDRARVRLVARGADSLWEGRGQCFAAPVEAVRRVLVEPARRNRGPERGGDFTRHDLDPEQPSPPGPSPRLLA